MIFQIKIYFITTASNWIPGRNTSDKDIGRSQPDRWWTNIKILLWFFFFIILFQIFFNWMNCSNHIHSNHFFFILNIQFWIGVLFWLWIVACEPFPLISVSILTIFVDSKIITVASGEVFLQIILPKNYLANYFHSMQLVGNRLIILSSIFQYQD